MIKIKIFSMALTLMLAGFALAQGAAAAKPVAIAVSAKVTTYEELRRAISETKALSRKRAEQAVEQERVREAWEIGRLIDAHVLQHKERAGYDQQVLVRLAKDLGSSRTELSYMLQFARAYPIFPSTEILSWGDYRELLSINDPKERKTIATEAAKNKWTQKEVRQAVRKLKGVREEDGGGEEQLPPSTPGKPGTYRVVLARAGPYAGKLAIDLGFSNYVSLRALFQERTPQETASNSGGQQGATPGTFKEGDIVTSSQDVRGNYSLGTQTAADRLQKKDSNAVPRTPSDLLYTYNAYIYQVLDGDTVHAVVDLGFGFTTAQTLRLRGIDAPELSTADGMEAKKALEKMLGMAEGVPSTVTGEKPSRDAVPRTPYGTKVLIKTAKSDKYDRYLADVFYPSPQKAGRSNPPSSVVDVGCVYVNQSLVDQGYAVIVEE